MRWLWLVCAAAAAMGTASGLKCLAGERWLLTTPVGAAARAMGQMVDCPPATRCCFRSQRFPGEQPNEKGEPTTVRSELVWGCAGPEPAGGDAAKSRCAVNSCSFAGPKGENRTDPAPKGLLLCVCAGDECNADLALPKEDVDHRSFGRWNRTLVRSADEEEDVDGGAAAAHTGSVRLGLAALAVVVVVGAGYL